MTNLKEKIASLKKIMVTANDIQEPWNIFFDQLANDPVFMSMGKKTKASKVAPIITTIGKKFFHQEGRTTNVMAFVIQSLGLTHGTCQLDGQLVCFFYADDLNVGLATVIRPDKTTKIIRFTVLKLKKPLQASPMPNPGGIH